MKKIIPIILMSATSAFAADKIIDKDTSGEVIRTDTNYIISGNDITYTNTHGPRHPISSTAFVLGSYTGTKFVSSAVIAPSSNNLPFFGLNGMQFKGDTVDADITISVKEGATPIAVQGGFTVDNCTAIFEKATDFLWSDTNVANINVKNGGYLDFKVSYVYSKQDPNNTSVLYTTTPLNADKRVAFNIENGSTMVANMGAGDYKLNASNFAGKVELTTASGKYLYFSSGTSVISDQKTADASVFNCKLSLNGGSLLIDESNETSSIKVLSNYITMFSGTLTLNASNALRTVNGTNGQKDVVIEVGGGRTVSLVLGADNDLRILDQNNSASVLNVTLAGNHLSALTTKVENSDLDTLGIVYFTDFEEGLVKIENVDDSKISDETTYLTTCFKGGTKDSNFDLYWNPETKYLTAFAVPEPAEWAVVLGALAIAFVFMRRQTRK
ncbi:MAG: hypothetical protein J6B07_02680 [Opitutales bacterium]|nr:hypothetical protein [Opitutales bacterium]